MTQLAGGILAAWNDCAPEGLAEYEHWYAHHLAERVGVPGFREGRRYEAVPGEGLGAVRGHEEGLGPRGEVCRRGPRRCPG